VFNATFRTEYICYIKSYRLVLLAEEAEYLPFKIRDKKMNNKETKSLTIFFFHKMFYILQLAIGKNQMHNVRGYMYCLDIGYIGHRVYGV
jgi:hypothetical protein